MIKSRIKKILPWIAVTLWMGVIFYLSHQPGQASSDLSSGMTDMIMQVISRFFPFISVDEELFHHLIRKSAHFTAYFLLGMLVIYALRLPIQRGCVLALVICVLYATSDEVHQLFIPGRSGELKDVLIDSAGSTTGVTVYMLLSVICRRFKGRTNKNDTKPN